MRMMRWAAVALVALVPLFSHALETVHWQRLPLPVRLHVGEERVIFTDREMKVGVPANLKDRLRVQSANGAIYLRPAVPLQGVRVQLHDVVAGALVMLDVTAIDPEGQLPLEPLRIVTDTPVEKPAPISSAPSSFEAREPTTLPVPVLLTRHAAQNLYAPLRAVEPVAGISRVPLRESLNLSTLMPMLPVYCRAVAAWKMGDTFVTAVILRNVSPRAIELSPLQLQGGFTAATYQHPYLGPKGEATDTTAVYLVTKGRDLADSLLPASSGGRAYEK